MSEDAFHGDRMEHRVQRPDEAARSRDWRSQVHQITACTAAEGRARWPTRSPRTLDARGARSAPDRSIALVHERLAFLPGLDHHLERARRLLVEPATVRRRHGSYRKRFTAPSVPSIS